MRTSHFALAFSSTLMAAASAAPLAAQVRVGVHIDLPIRIGAPVVIHRPAPPPPPRYVVVYDYSPRDFGRWERDARQWHPVTLYLWEGRYYDVPVPHARLVHVFQYHDRYFFEPRDRGWNDYRDHVLRPRYDDRDGDRWDGRNDRDGRDDRDYRDSRDDRGDRDARDVRDGRSSAVPVSPRARPRHGGR